MDRNISLLITGFRGESVLENHDLWIENGRIRAIEPSRAAVEFGRPDAETVDAQGKLVMPGLVNAHLHSTETFYKGMVDSLPYDLWRLVTYPLLSDQAPSSEEIYLRTLVTGIQMLKSGITTAVDDVAFYPYPDMEKTEAVIKAYEKLGIRAYVSANLLDVPFHRTIPWVSQEMPDPLIRKLEAVPSIGAGDQIRFARECLRRWPAGERCGFILAPSAPQRCTPDFYKAIARLSEEYDAPMHVHVLETKTQAVTANVFYGRTMIEYMRDLGVLTPRTTVIHGIWVTERDISLIAENGARVVHNPVSNLKLGSGIAPVREYLRAGIPVALGCDGTSSNDSQNMWETVKLSALLHKVRGPGFENWLTAAEALDMATRGGAMAVLGERDFGAVQVGQCADLVMLDLKSHAFTPLHDPIHQLAYCENGGSVDTVVVDGKIVVRNGEIENVKEESVLLEARKCVEASRLEYMKTVERNQVFYPYVKRMYDRCMEMEIGLNRFAE